MPFTAVYLKVYCKLLGAYNSLPFRGCKLYTFDLVNKLR
jgi:hypothetical protein